MEHKTSKWTVDNVQLTPQRKCSNPIIIIFIQTVLDHGCKKEKCFAGI